MDKVMIPLERMQQWYNYTIAEFANLVDGDDGYTIVADDDESERFFKQIENPVGKLYFHQEEDAEILFVAHLDTVVKFDPEIKFKLEEVESTNKDKTKLHKLTSAFHDDREGVAIIMEIIRRDLGIKCDILFCDEEERGRSTAQFFKPEEFGINPAERWRYIAEWDRAGTDVVTYCFGRGTSGSEWEAKLKEFFTVGNGSFSDIAYLEHLGIKAVNLGTGYQKAHSPDSYIILEWLAHMIKSYQAFHSNVIVQDMRFPHETTGYLDTRGKRYKEPGTTSASTTTSQTNTTSQFKRHPNSNTFITLDDTMETYPGIDNAKEFIYVVNASKKQCHFCCEQIEPEHRRWDGYDICQECVDFQLGMYDLKDVEQKKLAPPKDNTKPQSQGNTKDLGILMEIFIENAWAIGSSFGGLIGIDDVGFIEANMDGRIIVYGEKDMYKIGTDTNIVAGTCNIDASRREANDLLFMFHDGKLISAVSIDNMAGLIGDDKFVCDNTGVITKIADLAYASPDFNKMYGPDATVSELDSDIYTVTR